MNEIEILEARLLELAMLKKNELEKMQSKSRPSESDNLRIELLNKNMDATHTMLKYFRATKLH